ncbi:MAG TPA: protein kinase, partial [Pirellulales bacterium]
MSNLATCPDRDEIDRLRLGRLSLEQAAALDEHLLGCEPCCQVLHELDSSDLLGETLGTLRTREAAIDDRVRAVMARLKEMTLPGKAVEETLLHSRDATTDAWDLEKLLDPPQAEGELGRFAGYRVLRVLGAGGMGLVLEAEDPQLRRRVALKVMQRALAAHEENRQRFLREARATAAIEHAHIVTVHQVGVHNGLPFLAMQLLKGESLQDRVERARSGKKEDGLPSPSRIESDGLGRPSSLLPLPPGEGPGEGAWERSEVGQSDGQPIAAFLSPHPNPLPEGEGTRRPHSHPLAKREEPQRSLPLAEVLRIGREIAEALAEAHARNLIHRDIKPGNIWLEGASGWVKLVDFGLAHAAEDVHLTQTGAILGTPAYMSPEQARGETVDGRSDLYSLGAVLYKLTTGDVPFRGASTMAVLMALATETPRPPIELNPDIPPALNDLILRLLAKKPADRYESAMAVAEAIRQIEASRVGIAHHRVADATDANPASATHSHGPGGQCPPYGRRPRWPLVAAAAAAAFLLATIVIIVRDKDGKELFRGIVPDGGSLTVTAGDAATKIEPKLPDSSVPPKGEASPPSRRAGIAEPPPLEEWLRGRTMLTVAQDGSGQFKTIQAALDALQAGQVVKVLDRGPYREQLNVRVLPADTGLVSEVGTSIEPPAYGVINKGSVWEAEVAHYFRQMEGFRLAGFTIASPEPGAGRNGPNTFCLDTFCCEGFVLERCWLRGTAQFHVGGHAGDGGKPACVRECLIENMLHVASRDNDDAVVLVARNLFVGANAIVAIGEESIYRHIGVTDNVFAGPKEGLEIHSPKHFGRLEITNNTFLGSNPIRWLYFDGNAVAAGEAIIVNNLRLRPGLLALLPGPTPAAGDLPAQIQGAVRQSWHVARNCYPRDLRPGDSDYQVSVVKFPGDILGVPRLLSMVADNRDYLRPVADDAIARRGAGGEWPDYIGALPPGPAPKEGDWFTRLRERWTSVGWALPTTEPNVGNARPAIPEPPPLEEWLKGRTVLTVAQDGSGQFKTIQSALNALKPHQVVKVLDRGPYRESIQSGGLPDDTGLISDRQATVETLAWPDGGEAHAIGPVEKFRLAGIRFVAPPRDSWGTLVFCGEPSGLVVEDCCFSLTAALDP